MVDHWSSKQYGNVAEADMLSPDMPDPLSPVPSKVYASQPAGSDLQAMDLSASGLCPMSDEDEEDRRDAERWLDDDLLRVLDRDDRAWEARVLRVRIW